MNTELDIVKEESYRNLISLGYTEDTARRIVKSYCKITGYFNGKPSRVMTTAGTEIYL